MPIVDIKGVGNVDFPDSWSHDKIVDAIQNQVIPQYQQHLAKTGFTAATKAGWHGAKGSAEKYLGELTGSDTLKQYAEEAKAQAQKEFEPTTSQDVANAEGILPTIGRQISKSAGEPVGGIVGSFGAPVAAAVATPFVLPEAAAAALGTAGVGALSAGVGTVAGLPAMAGETLERQEALGQKPDLVSATATGLFKSALMNITIPGVGAATKGISRALGDSLQAQAEGMAQKVINGELSHEAAVQALSGYGKQLARNMAINTVTGSAMMVGSEAADRVATGEDLTSPEALSAYGHNVQTAAELSPIFGGLHGLGERGKAKAVLADAKDRNETINQINADRAQRNLDITNIKEDNRARAEAAFRAADEAQRAQIRAQIKADPERSILDIINEVTGVNAEPVDISSQKLNAHWNMPSGRFVSDPATGIERELTRGEMHQQQYPELFAEEPVPEPLALPAPEMISYPNGVVAHPDAVRNYITSLPEDQRNAARAELLGYAKQPVPQVPGIVTPEVIPTQKLIEQNLGIGKKPYTSTPENVKAALTEQTGARVQKEGQIERPETEFDVLKRENPKAFAEAPLTSLPPLDKAALNHMGFQEGKAGYAPMLKLGKDPVGNADKINDLLDTHLKSNKTLNQEAIATYRSAIDVIRQNQRPDVSAEPGATGAAVEPSVSVPKPRGQRVARGATEPTVADVGNDRVLTSGADTGKNAEPAPLVEEAPAVSKATLKAHDDALEKAYDLRLGEVNRNQVKSFADRLVRHGIIDEKQRESYAAMLRDKHTEAEDILSELETDVEINKERLQKGPKVESAKAGNWRDAVDAESDAFKKADIFRSIADISKSDKELKDILTRLKSTDPEVGNITWAIEHNPNALISTKARAKQFRLDAEKETSKILQNEERATKRKDYEAKLLGQKYDDAVEAYNTLAKKPDVTREELAKLDEAVTKARKAYDKTTYAEEARGRTEGGHTAESLRSELTNEFGEQGIASLEKRGILNLHDTVEHAPEHIRSAVESDAIGAHSEGTTHLFADRIGQGEGRRGLLHEVGEHYGLKGMLGERVYNNLLDTIAKNAHKDPVIKEAIDHVATNYPELRDNPAQFAREVVARVGETAPTHTVWRRIVAGVKNFLVKMGLMKNLNARDIQDLVQHSLRTAMKRDIEAPKMGVEAARKLKELGATWTPKRIQKILDNYAYHGTKDGDEFKTIAYATKISPQQFLDITATKEEQRNVTNESRPLNKKDLEAFEGEMYLRVNLTNDPNVMEVVGHEGRHRMTALKNAGVKDVPISVIFGVHAGESYRSIEKPLDVAYFTAQRKSSVLGEGEQGAWVGDLTPINLAYQKELFSKYQIGDIEFAKGPGKRLDGSPLKQPKPYTGRMPESIKKLIDGEGSMWERLGRELGAFKNLAGTAVIRKDFNIERKALDKGIPGVSSKVGGVLRADRIYQQAQSNVALSHSGMERGGLRVMPSGLIEAWADKENPANMQMISDMFHKMVNQGAKDVGDINTAHDMISMAWVAPRYENIIRNNEHIDRSIAALRASKPEGYGAVVEQLENQKKYVGDWDEHDRAAAAEAERRYGPQIAEMRKTWNIMRGRLLDFMVDTQNMTKELAEEYLDNIDYVPFYRIPDEELVDAEFRPLSGSSLQNAGKQYRFKGSDKKQADVLTNMMANVSWMMQKGILNNAAIHMTRLEEQLGDGRWVDAEHPAVKGKTVTVWKEGKPKEFVLDDINDMAAFGGNPIIQGWIWDMARASTSFLRHGVTMFPQFVWNQAWEDPIRATFVSGNKAGFLSNIAQTWKSIWKNQISAEHTEGAEALYRSGVIGQKDVMSESDVERRYSGEDKAGWRKSLFFFERLAQGSDLGARESIYTNAMKELKAEGYDEATAHAVATSRAIQYMPHQQVGNSKTMAYLRAMMPFVNSPIQGYARDIAAARGRIDGVSKEQGQKMLAFRLAKYAAFIGAYAAFRSGDPDYESQTADQRDNNFYIAGTKIPAPQELRAFKAAIERGTRAYALNAPGADLEGSDIGAAILRKNWELIAGLALPVPTAIRPVLEGVTNYNIHTGRPLVGQGLQDREAYLQYNDNTSEVGKLMGGWFNVSPIKVDNFITGYGGYLGQTIEKFSNALVSGRPTQSVNDWLFVGSLMEPEFGGGPRTETYELADKVARVKSTMKALKDEGRIDELKEYIQKNRGYIGGEDSVSRAHQAVTNIRRYQAQVNASNMDPDAKRAKLDQLKQTELNALANVHELHRRIVEANNEGS